MRTTSLRVLKKCKGGVCTQRRNLLKVEGVYVDSQRLVDMLGVVLVVATFDMGNTHSFHQVIEIVFGTKGTARPAYNEVRRRIY